MKFYEDAHLRWDKFLKTKISNYKKFRNYDFGPNSENFVSKLSPFVSHRVIFEYQILIDIHNYVKGKEYIKVDKFIEEIYWRIYWKGYLENKPCIWNDFLNIKIDAYDKELYERALKAKTELSFFNSWINELKEFNYLHNHTRMWFASTWIFNLGLPWHLGARLFFRYLYDGDAASNLLSWRWVAGLQTKGKKYIFTPQNLNKYSNNRFFVDNISNKQINLEDKFEKVFDNSIFESDMKKKSDYLILFENDLHFQTLKDFIKNYKKVFLIILDNKDRQIMVSNEVTKFKKNLASEFVRKFSNIELISSSDIFIKLKNINQLDLIYPSIGDNNDFINRFRIISKKKINNLVRNQDLYSWQFAKKGFFKFKENIPLINKYILESQEI